MEKKFAKSKIIILTIAILLAILSFSIAIFGIIELNKKDKNSEGATATSFSLGDKTYTLYRSLIDGGRTYYYYEDAGCTKVALYFYRSSDVYYVSSSKGFYYVAYTTQSGSIYDINLKNNIVIAADSGFTGLGNAAHPYKQDIIYNGYTITNNTNFSLICNDMTISTVQELKDFSSQVNSGTDFSGATVKLAKDIVFSDSDSFTPIGTKSKPFKGTFDGNGHTIKNLPMCKNYYSTHHNGFLGIGAYDSYENYFGLFEYINGATIINLHIDNAQWSNTMGASQDGLYGGILAARAKGSCVIQNCLITGSKLELTNNDGQYVDGGYVTNERSCIGSLIGKLDDNGSVSILKTGAVVNVISKGIINIGGMVGNLGSNATSNISNSYFKGALQGQHVSDEDGTDMSLGGLVGGFSSKVSASNCYVSLTKVRASSYYTYFPSDTGIGTYSIGDHKYSEYAAILTSNIENKIYYTDCQVKYYEGGHLSASEKTSSTLISQVEKVGKDILP